jgi:hypothetical protein
MPVQTRRCLRLLESLTRVAQPGCPDAALLPLAELWPGYAGSDRDSLRIEVFETWLEEVQ